VKIILSSLLALALTALGARAQTSTETSKTNPGSMPGSTAEDKGAAGMPTDQSSSAQPGSTSTLPGDKAVTAPAAPTDKAASAIPSDNSAKAAPAPSDSTALPVPPENSTAASDTANKSDDSSPVIKKKHPKKLRHPEAQGRSGMSGMHRRGVPDQSTNSADKTGKADLPPVDDNKPAATPPAPPITPDQHVNPAPEKGK
jgi:hypothetical protein